jgi:oligosaccharide reducing-end xylanase
VLHPRSGVGTASAVLALALGVAACGQTTDSIGFNGTGGAIHLRPLTRLTSYPNAFKAIMKSDADIANKLANWFASLFHGDPDTAAIYVAVTADQANIQDILHKKEVRTEGIGLAMMICVQLDKREEFDRLWTYASTVLEYKDPPRRGYFHSRCDTTLMATEDCDDPYGEQQMTMALIFAHDRWGSTTTIDYETEAIELLTVMRHKQDENGGIVDGVTDTFDSVTALPFDYPTEERATAQWGRPSIAIPAYYNLWAEATGDPFWTRAAAAARDYWQKTAHPTTGLIPVRATFAGEGISPWDAYLAEAYRAQINMVLQQIWTMAGRDTWEVTEADRVLDFFSGVGINSYAATYTLDGAPLDSNRDTGLIAVNGVTAMITAEVGRDPFVQQAWDLGPPTGIIRYYSGILGLTSLLILSGQYQIW